MNRFVLIESENDVDIDVDLFLKVAKVIHKDFKLIDIWNDYDESEKGFSFGDVTLTFYDDREIVLEIRCNEMSIDRQFELYKACNEVILEYKGIM